MREVVLDLETTGLDPEEGHRVVEICGLELINHLPTGKIHHTYVNPERDVPDEASAISGLKTDFLKPFPIFSKVIDDFLHFLGDDKLVIHNAPFDIKFLNAELKRLNYPPFPLMRAIDTLQMARNKFPGSPASLDALCRRFKIDLSSREKHGALIDCELLAKVYLELLGGRQTSLSFQKIISTEKENLKTGPMEKPTKASLRTARPHEPTLEELEAHKKLIGTFKKSLWT